MNEHIIHIPEGTRFQTMFEELCLEMKIIAARMYLSRIAFQKANARKH